MSFGVASLAFGASIPGKAFTGYVMEIIGRRWTICYALMGSLPGLSLMLLAHRMGGLAGPMTIVGALLTGFTALSAGTAARIYLSGQFPTALLGRGHMFGESFGRLFSGVLAPFLMTPYTGSPPIFFGTILTVAIVGVFNSARLRPRNRRPARSRQRNRARTGVGSGGYMPLPPSPPPLSPPPCCSRLSSR